MCCARRLIAVRGDEDDRACRGFADAPRRLDAVHAAGEADVHQDQVDVEVAGLLDGALAVRHQAAHLEMLVAHQGFQMPRHQQFVFDDQHARRTLRSWVLAGSPIAVPGS